MSFKPSFFFICIRDLREHTSLYSQIVTQLKFSGILSSGEGRKTPEKFDISPDMVLTHDGFPKKARILQTRFLLIFAKFFQQKIDRPKIRDTDS